VSARFCLACGARLVTVAVEGQRRRQCPRCGWTFYANPAPAVVAIMIAGRRVLLTRRARPPYANAWDLPGGFLEAHEAPLAGLRRELREELGVGIRNVRLVGFATDQYGPGGVAVLSIVYRVAPTSERVRASDDVSEARWFRSDALPFREIAFPGVRRLLRRYLAARGRTRRARAGSSRP
jgi:ADP-ribose pyrophosphatase YjhB (NUDIX family)